MKKNIINLSNFIHKRLFVQGLVIGYLICFLISIIYFGITYKKLNKEPYYYMQVKTTFTNEGKCFKENELIWLCDITPHNKDLTWGISYKPVNSKIYYISTSNYKKCKTLHSFRD